jgi:hypothetical protein
MNAPLAREFLFLSSWSIHFLKLHSSTLKAASSVQIREISQPTGREKLQCCPKAFSEFNSFCWNVAKTSTFNITLMKKLNPLTPIFTVSS